MTDKLQQLADLAKDLPKGAKENALELVRKMGEKIEGIGDAPIEWRAENLRVVQPSSDRSRLPKGTNIGAMIIGEHVAPQPLEVIPLRMWDSRQMWSPDKDEARLMCSSPDAVFGYIGKNCKDCEYSKFDEEAGRSACNKSKTVLSITADLSTVFMANFTKTNYANGREWYNLMKKAGVAPYRKIYEMKTETNKKYKNVESLLVDTNNKSTPKEYIPFLEALFDKFGADREAHKVSFYEMVKNKTAKLEALPSDDIPALPAAEVDSTPQQSDMAKKYSL